MFIEAPFTGLFSHNILKLQLIKVTTINYWYYRNKNKSILCLKHIYLTILFLKVPVFTTSLRSLGSLFQQVAPL